MKLLLAALLLLSPRWAFAEHDHAVSPGRESAFGAGVTMVAASFDTMFFVGNYQGIQPAVSWSNQRFAVGASGALYRVEENGATYYGFGDIVVHGQAALVRTAEVRAGVLAGVTAPVGDDRHGLGMGHPMVMPAAFGMWSTKRVSVAATAGYSRALGGDSEHDHGPWPLVEPMNMTELTWSTAGDVAITKALHGGVRFSGGVPIGDGRQRVVGAARAAWMQGRFTSAAELQAGLAGDPFTLRGVVSTALTF